MKNMIGNVESVLSNNVSGFHQYILSNPTQLCYVSRNLCIMLGFSEQELLGESGDLYALRVHPADQAAYGDFLHALGDREQTLTLQYRLVRKDGGVIYVSDTSASSRLPDGRLVSSSVLTDITELKNENQNLRFLDETMPCGFIKYTCEKNPRVTYINKQMLHMLRFPESSGEESVVPEMLMQNIYLMIPMEERARFSRYLDRVYEHGTPIAGEMAVLRCDGTKAYLFGWVTKCVNEQGFEEYQSACMDITERHEIKKERETKQYIKALTEVYDKVFEFDLTNHTVKCLYSDGSPMFRWVENVPMQMEKATDKWIVETVCQEDRERVSTFFKDFCQEKGQSELDAQPPQIKYRALSSSGKIKTYSGIFLRLDHSISLFCCRNIPEVREADALRSENDTLKNMQELVMRFTEGIVAFEVENDTVKPLYVSDNVCSFFGYTKEHWLSMAEKRQSIREFISQSGITYEEVQTLFATGAAEFTYFDMTQNAYRRIKAICSQKASGGNSHCYVMLYNIDANPENVSDTAAEQTNIYIRTFGYFDVFVDERPIAFRNEKSKELFALLVDRRGGYVSSDEAISFLWEDEPINPVTLARYRKVALRLKNILEEYGISDIVESVNGKRRLITEKVRCDLYDYLSGQEEFAQLFKGSYLTNYSWGEGTLSELTGDYLHGAGD